jgi:hypothetical protein
MTPEHEQELKQEFPTFFTNNFFFECDDGWRFLIKDIAKYITSRTIYCYAAQIKEKFGSLRVYVEYEFNMDYESKVDPRIQADIEKAIRATENASKTICMACGIKITEKNKPVKTRNYFEESICKNCV